MTITLTHHDTIMSQHSSTAQHDRSGSQHAVPPPPAPSATGTAAATATITATTTATAAAATPATAAGDNDLNNDWVMLPPAVAPPRKAAPALARPLRTAASKRLARPASVASVAALTRPTTWQARLWHIAQVQATATSSATSQHDPTTTNASAVAGAAAGDSASDPPASTTAVENRGLLPHTTSNDGIRDVAWCGASCVIASGNVLHAPHCARLCRCQSKQAHSTKRVPWLSTPHRTWRCISPSVTAL